MIIYFKEREFANAKKFNHGFNDAGMLARIAWMRGQKRHPIT
jgi:hypothetical protein